MQRILAAYEDEMFLHRNNLMIYDSLSRSEVGISNRKLVFAYLEEQMKCSSLTITDSDIDSSKLLYDVVCNGLKEEQIMNIQYMNCVGLSCLILVLLMKSSEFNIQFLLNSFSWPNFSQNRNESIKFIMSVLKGCDYNIIISSNFEMSISSYTKEIEEIKEEKDEICKIYNEFRDNDINVLLYSNSILIYSILLNKYKDNYEINTHLRSLFDNYFDKMTVEKCIDEINSFNNNSNVKPIVKIIEQEDCDNNENNLIQKRRVCSPITILNCGDNNNYYNNNNSNNSTPRKIRKIDSDCKINICDNIIINGCGSEDIDYLNCYSCEDDSLCSLFC